MATATQLASIEGLKRLSVEDSYYSYPEHVGRDATTLPGGRELRTISSAGDRLSGLLFPLGRLKIVKQYLELEGALGKAYGSAEAIESAELALSVSALRAQVEYRKEIDLPRSIDEANQMIAEGNYWAESWRSQWRGVLAPLSRVYLTNSNMYGFSDLGFGVVVLDREGQEGLPAYEQGEIFV